MTDVLVPTFEASSLHAPPDGKGGNPHVKPAKTRQIPLDVYETQVRNLLDSDGIEGDEIIDAMLFLDQRFLERVDPMLKARMLGVLSREIRAIETHPERSRDEGEKIYAESMRDAGQFLSRCTQFPEEIVDRFLKPENDLMEEFAELYRNAMAQEKIGTLDRIVEIYKGIRGEPTKRQLRDLDIAVSEAEVQDMTEDFLALFSKHYELKRGIKAEFFHAAQRDKDGHFLFGQQSWDTEGNRPLMKLNTAVITKVADLPKFVLTKGHEGAHCVFAQMHKDFGRRNLEDYRESDPEYYIMMQLTDRTFYTSEDRAIYRWHPEEVVAQRVGLGLAIRMADLLGMTPEREHFLSEMREYDAPQVTNEVFMRLGERQEREGAVSGIKGAATRATNWLKKNL